MLTRLEQAQDRWGGTSHIIDNWLEARKELLIAYCELAGLPPFDKQANVLPSADKITRFCQQLVDYASTGHFEIYEQIVGCCDSEKTHQLIPQITETTDVALNFNDRYAEQAQSAELEHFDNDLSILGQAMEKRFEVEDLLLDQLHQHAQTQRA